uniref:hypothetical protein n=1 Tax=Rhodococcus sp. UNC363MFTsu5.1 TaxID=1449069 RepID=UPI000488AAC7
MTILTANVRDIEGADDMTVFKFHVPIIRGTDPTGAGVVTTRTYRVQAEEGILTTPDLQPGPCTLKVHASAYAIDIPDSPTPVLLWPLIDAAAPPPATTEGFVRNGGGISRSQRITVSDYAALVTP